MQVINQKHASHRTTNMQVIDQKVQDMVQRNARHHPKKASYQSKSASHNPKMKFIEQ